MIDPRYEWRLLDEPIGMLVASIERVLGGQRPSQDFADSRLVWLDLPPGTAFDLLCALARVHGDLVWVFEEQEAEDKKITGLGHRLWWLAGGGGRGIPVR